MWRGPLRRPAFRLLFLGQSVSALGDRVVPVALAFAVLDLTGSVADLGIVLAAAAVPLVVFVLIGGVWADRLPRQQVMLASDLVRGGAQAASAALLLSGHATILVLALLQALYGTAGAFFEPAANALRPQTVAPEQLQQANALMGLTINLADVLGPALAGLLVATAGPGWGLALDAATFAVSAGFLALLRTAPVARVREAPAGMWRELRAGWSAFRARTWLWVSTLFFTLFMALAFSPMQVLGPQIARLYLGGPGAWAAISSALGVGSVAGGLIALRHTPRHPLRATFLATLLSTPLLLASLAAHAPLWLILGAALFEGSLMSLFNVYWFTVQQRAIPAAELSRVSSWDVLGTLALRPAGLALVGPLALAWGFSSTLYAAAGAAALLTLAVLAVPSVRNLGADGEQVPAGTAGAGDEA